MPVKALIQTQRQEQVDQFSPFFHSLSCKTRVLLQLFVVGLKNKVLSCSTVTTIEQLQLLLRKKNKKSVLTRIRTCIFWIFVLKFFLHFFNQFRLFQCNKLETKQFTAFQSPNAASCQFRHSVFRITLFMGVKYSNLQTLCEFIVLFSALNIQSI